MTLLDPAATPVTTPLEPATLLTVATPVETEDQVTESVMLKVELSE
jgi:hypothetical protein